MILRNPLRPFSPFPHPPGQWYSPLDARAEAIGVTLVEQSFRESSALGQLAEALGRLIRHNERGSLALRKALHISFESRLRTMALHADPPQTHGLGSITLPSDRHPLDPWLARGLDLPDPPVRFSDRIWHLVELITVAVALVGRAVWMGLRLGRRRVVPRPCRLLALNPWPEWRWIGIADSLAEHAGFKPGDLLGEVSASAKADLAVLPPVRPDKLPVAIGAWLKDAVYRSAGLAVTAVTVGLGNLHNACVVEAAVQALRLANRVLDARRLVGAIQFEACVDNMEADPRHILIGAMAPGSRMVRMPHSEMDTNGAMSSYLGYDLFLSSGRYPSDAFGTTWMRGTRSISVGPIQQDRRLRSPAHISSEYRSAVESGQSRGQRMVVIFGPSDIAGVWPLFLRQVEAVLDAAACRDGWIVVIKPKGTDRLYAMAERNPGLARKLRGDRVICVRYPIPNHETCSTGYLMTNMTLGVSIGGSVVTEALCQERPILIYYPVVGDTPLRKRLSQLNLLHTTEQSFRSALDAFLTNSRGLTIPFAWFQDRFSPFGDERSLDRLAAALYPEPGQAAPLEPERARYHQMRSP